MAELKERILSLKLREGFDRYLQRYRVGAYEKDPEVQQCSFHKCRAAEEYTEFRLAIEPTAMPYVLIVMGSIVLIIAAACSHGGPQIVKTISTNGNKTTNTTAAVAVAITATMITASMVAVTVVGSASLAEAGEILAVAAVILVVVAAILGVVGVAKVEAAKGASE